MPKRPASLFESYKMMGGLDFLIDILRAQSFTSLMVDLRQDINRGFTFGMCLNGTFP